jgi:CubicO group peptidase (beta-lactamase class C family)
MLFEVGKGYHYSDMNYILTGMIIEQATQSTNSKELTKHILNWHYLKNTLPASQLPSLVPGCINPNSPFAVKGEKSVEEGRFIFHPQSKWTGGDLSAILKILCGGQNYFVRRNFLTSLISKSC